MYSEIYDLVDIVRIEIKHEALAKIARRTAQNAVIGYRKCDIATAHMAAARNKFNIQRNMIKNQQLSIWRNRNRTHQ